MPDKTRFEFLLFEEMLMTDLHPAKVENTLINKTPEAVKEEIDRETLRIINEFKNVLCDDYDEPHLERYIQLHVRSATSLLDRVYMIIKPEADEMFSEVRLCGDCMEVYMHLKTGVKTILNYIEKELDRYFDLNAAVPESFRAASARQLLFDRDVLDAKMRSKEICPLLKGLVLDYVSGHCALESCSYLEQKYVKMLVAHLLRVLKSNETKDWNRKMVVELVYLNFNKSIFFTWCRKFIAADVDGYGRVKEQALRFNWYLKEIKPLDSKPNVFYKPGRPGIRELLEQYICGELVYLSESHKGGVPAEPVQNFKERAEKFDFKLPLNLSTPQLGLIVQLFIDVGVFVVEKGQIMTVMKFFEANVSTIGAESISAENLYKLRKKAEPRVCDAIEGILERMLVLLRNEFLK